MNSLLSMHQSFPVCYFKKIIPNAGHCTFSLYIDHIDWEKNDKQACYVSLPNDVITNSADECVNFSLQFAYIIRKYRHAFARSQGTPVHTKKHFDKFFYLKNLFLRWYRTILQEYQIEWLIILSVSVCFFWEIRLNMTSLSLSSLEQMCDIRI